MTTQSLSTNPVARCWRKIRNWRLYLSLPAIVLVSIAYILFEAVRLALVLIWSFLSWFYSMTVRLSMSAPRWAGAVICLLLSMCVFLLMFVAITHKKVPAEAASMDLSLPKLLIQNSLLPKFVIGKGMWIYQLRKCEGGDIQKILARAKWAGLDYVLIKTHDGSDWVTYNPKERVADLIAALHRAGIKVYAWGYVYGRYPEAEGARAIEAMELGSDGYVFNCEVHMRNRAKAAETMCSIVRQWVDASAPDRVLGYSTFCRIQNQAGIPFEVYDRHCDFAMPQVYFSWFSGWTARQAAARTMNIWLAEQAGWDHYPKPIIPTLECSSGAADMPATKPSDLEIAAEGFSGYFGLNFYSWDVSTQALWEKVKKAPGSLDYQRRVNQQKALQEAGLMEGGLIE